MIIPVLASAIAAVSAFLSFFLSVRWTVALLVIGLIVVGIVASLISADAFQIFMTFAVFGGLMMAGSVALGIAAGLRMRDKKFIRGVLFLAPFPFFIWHTHTSDTSAAAEKAGAFEFVSHNEQLRKLVGGQFEASLVSHRTRRNSGVTQYEYRIVGKDLFAMVDASRANGGPRFRLACVTSIPQGQRESLKDACLQSPVALPPVSKSP